VLASLCSLATLSRGFYVLDIIMSSQIARLKAQLEAKNSASHGDALIGHHTSQRTLAEKERIQIETAKKMAARINLTHRALALSSSRRIHNQR
jgi:uncharacterized small protein (DUF1192 family)